MNKQEALQKLQEAVRGFNEELESYQDEVQFVTALQVPEDVEEARALEYDIPSEYDLPTRDHLDDAIETLARAYSDFEDISSEFKVTFTASVTVDEVDTDDDARDAVLGTLEEAFVDVAVIGNMTVTTI